MSTNSTQAVEEQVKRVEEQKPEAINDRKTAEEPGKPDEKPTQEPVKPEDKPAEVKPEEKPAEDPKKPDDKPKEETKESNEGNTKSKEVDGEEGPSFADLMSGSGLILPNSAIPASKQWYYSNPGGISASQPHLLTLSSPTGIQAALGTLGWLLISAMGSALCLLAMATMVSILRRIGREKEEEADLPRFWSSERTRRRMAAAISSAASTPVTRRGQGQWPAEMVTRNTRVRQPQTQLTEEPLFSAPAPIRSAGMECPPTVSIQTPTAKGRAESPPSYAVAMGKPPAVLRTIYVNQPLYTA